MLYVTMSNQTLINYEYLLIDNAKHAFTIFQSVVELLAETIDLKIHDMYERLNISIIKNRATVLEMGNTKYLVDYHIRPQSYLPYPDTNILEIRNGLSESDQKLLNDYLEAKIRDIRIFYDAFMANYGHLYQKELSNVSIDDISELRVDSHMRFFLKPTGRCIYMRITKQV